MIFQNSEVWLSIVSYLTLTCHLAIDHLAEGLVATENLPSPTTPSRPSSPSVSIASGHNSDTVNSMFGLFTCLNHLIYAR